MNAPTVHSRSWPALPVADWRDTRDTLHLLTQIVGKICLAHAPLVNHWWNTALSVSANGLATSLIPYSENRSFQIDFDFHAHRLNVVTNIGEARAISLASRPIADYYNEILDCLDELGLTTKIWPMPVEIENAIRFPDDRQHATYHPAHVERFWRSLVEVDRVFSAFRARFVGKCSPVHMFWGALDLAVTRFSGRPAPPYRGDVPNCGPHVMLEAYSHELSSAGYWPGGDLEGAFYSYAYPEPAGYPGRSVSPQGATYSEELREFVLPYRLVRTAAEPDKVLLEFLQSTYEAAATCAHWDRAAIERHA